jgi:hypothetical protein
MAVSVDVDVLRIFKIFQPNANHGGGLVRFVMTLSASPIPRDNLNMHLSNTEMLL